VLRIIRHALLATVGLAVILLAVLLARPQWLVPALADLLLPSGWHLDELTVVAETRHGFPRCGGSCCWSGAAVLLSVEDAGATLRWNGVTPALDVVQVGLVEIEPACLPAGPGRGLARSIRPAGLWPLPGTRLQVDALVVAGWLPQPHGLAVRAWPGCAPRRGSTDRCEAGRPLAAG